jgi:hypothetical protein
VIGLLLAKAALVFVLGVAASGAQAATDQIDFYEEGGGTSNLFTDFSLVGSGTFEIGDGAVAPDNLVLFSDSAFIAFDVVVDQTGEPQRRYTRGVDDFPPVDSLPNDGTFQGLLFDSNAAPLRFDNPATTARSA